MNNCVQINNLTYSQGQGGRGTEPNTAGGAFNNIILSIIPQYNA